MLAHSEAIEDVNSEFSPREENRSAADPRSLTNLAAAVGEGGNGNGRPSGSVNEAMMDDTGTGGSARTHCCGASLPPPSELYVYLVALFCGVSIMLPTNAVFSAPSYIMNFYKYAMRDEHAVARHPNFWNNSLTYYSLLSMVVCLIMEPLTLAPRFRQIPIMRRLLGGLFILMMEVVLLMSVPAGGTSEGGAITTICFAGLISGFGKSVFESTTYGMFGAFPPRFTSIMMGGVGMSGVLTSLIQIIVKGALGDGYQNVITQSRIYYSLDVGIQCCTFTLVLLLRFNSFAKRQFGGLGGRRRSHAENGDDVGAPPLQPVASSNHDSGSGVGCLTSERGREESESRAAPGDPAPLAREANSDGPHPAADRYKVNTDGRFDEPVAKDVDEQSEGASAEASRNVEAGPQIIPVGGPVGGSGVTITDSHDSKQVLMATDVWATLRRILWMFVACGFNFLVTLMLFPTVTVSADNADYWYGTIAVFIFNVFDVLGRFTPSLKVVWPRTYRQRYFIVAGSFGRAIFLPLLILYSYHYITGHAFGYVMMILFGYSNGYIGSMALVLGPMSRGISDDGQRFVAGTMMGISILVGGTIGMVLSITMQAVRGE